MKKSGYFCSILLFNHLCLMLLSIAALHDNAAASAAEGEKKLYIIYLGDHLADHDSAVDMHLNLLSAVKRSNGNPRECLLYSYTKSFNAFAAHLSEEEANEISGMDGVLSVFPNEYHQLHTTESWDFIGLPQTVRRDLKAETDVIVGVLDSGITVEAESFKDDGLGPPPSKWKGTCFGQFADFSGCNNKVIGAQYFNLAGSEHPSDILSPVDVSGHGTHASSTIAGNAVPNASLYGLAEGTARGGVPSARLAMYKVCWVTARGDRCSSADILAAFESAIHDGVDLISISVGVSGQSYLANAIAIGSFHAMKKGILTVASAGNDGPRPGTVTNHAPWILTVAASGIDRDFRSKVSLGNGQTIEGVGINGFETEKNMYPLIRGADAAWSSEGKDNASRCEYGSLDPSKVFGKIVYCQGRVSPLADSVVKGVGGAGTIVEHMVSPVVASISIIPGTTVNYSTGEAIHEYIDATRSPSAVIHKSTDVKIPAPFVPPFSSRGPNPGSRNILKPDIAAPSVNILAAYTRLRPITGKKGDTQFSKYNLMSGTSVACPHVAGAAAYVKSLHTDWSPSMIKSAIITTATPISGGDAEFAYGAGQLNPSGAKDPGLVYEAYELSYIQFLCNEGYKQGSSKNSINCSEVLGGVVVGQDALNYPTIQLSLENSNDEGQATAGIFKRTVTNVGPAQATFTAAITAPPGVSITVNPMTLNFTRRKQKKSFTVVVEAKADEMASQIASGSLVWRSSRHLVRTPIVVYDPQSFEEAFTSP